MRQGRTLIDFNWKLDLQVASHDGASNLAHLLIQLESEKNGEAQVDLIEMKGEQFMAFFANLKKVKENLIGLVQGENQK